MKKRYLLLVLSIIAVAVAAIGATMAKNSDEGVSLTSTISEKTVGVKANKALNETVSAMPGKEESVNYFITNDGGASNGTKSDLGNYDIYAKVNVYLDWEQAEDSKVKYGDIEDEDNFLKLFVGASSEELPFISSYSKQVSAGDWIVTYYDGSQITMYYKKPLAINQSSSDYLSKIVFDKSMDNRYQGAGLHITADVSAVQVNSAEATFATEWGVYPKFVTDNKGNKILKSVSEKAN